MVIEYEYRLAVMTGRHCHQAISMLTEELKSLWTDIIICV